MKNFIFVFSVTFLYFMAVLNVYFAMKYADDRKYLMEKVKQYQQAAPAKFI